MDLIDTCFHTELTACSVHPPRTDIPPLCSDQRCDKSRRRWILEERSWEPRHPFLEGTCHGTCFLQIATRDKFQCEAYVRTSSDNQTEGPICRVTFRNSTLHNFLLAFETGCYRSLWTSLSEQGSSLSRDGRNSPQTLSIPDFVSNNPKDKKRNRRLWCDSWRPHL